jgi:Ser/Thr protein kinase RdoA (MazF antagonist)
MQWRIIEKALPTIQHAESGYTMAHRGIITLDTGQRIFVKLGVDENTSAWAQKEIMLYEFLASQNYAHIPKLLATNSEQTAFALEALEAKDGWDWSNTWTHERLNATLAAMDELAQIRPTTNASKLFGSKGLSQTSDGWSVLAADPEKQKVLEKKLKKAGHGNFMKNTDYTAMADQSAQFIFQDDRLVHYDIRTDNCAWNAEQNRVKLIDWNWAQMGDVRIDAASMLVHVHRAGLDISQHNARLNPGALQWVAGLWLNAAATPMWPGASEKSHLRDYQLESGVAALKLCDAV